MIVTVLASRHGSSFRLAIAGIPEPVMSELATALRSRLGQSNVSVSGGGRLLVNLSSTGVDLDDLLAVLARHEQLLRRPSPPMRKGPSARLTDPAWRPGGRQPSRTRQGRLR